VLKQLQQMRSGNSMPLPSASAAPIAAPAVRATRAPENTSAPVTPAPAEPSSQVAASVPSSQMDLENLWAQLVDSIGRASPFVRAYFAEAHPVSFVKNVFTIGFDPEFADHLPLVDNSRNHTLVQTKLAELGFPNSSVKFIKAEAPANRARSVVEPEPVVAASAPVKNEVAAAPQKSVAAPAVPAKAKTESVPFSKEDFKNDPLIQKALEIFKGQIVDVRS
jgi:DNA polymerase-3 subunit gamma/tau